jgi:transposase
MAAAAEPWGRLLACDVHPDQAADDPLDRPRIARVRQMLGRSGLLQVGDSTMAALATRADIVAHGDSYLMPLPLTGETAQQVEAWIDAVVAGEQMATLIWDEEGLLGGGDAVERPMSAEVDGKPVTWTERVQAVRSLALAERERQPLERRLANAEAALRALTPPGRSRRP